MFDPGAIAFFLGMALSSGRELVDFVNDMLNNVVSLTGDAHQARVAQDIFRQEIRYERSLQMREDIRDINKVMLESVTSYLFLGSIVLAECFTTIVEGFPPLEAHRMVRAWWLLFASWSVTFSLLGIWFALSFQVKISAVSRERLLRRYRYRLADDSVVTKMGGVNLVNAFLNFGAMFANFAVQTLDASSNEQPMPKSTSGKVGIRPWQDRREMSSPVHEASVPEAELKTRVQLLDSTAVIDATLCRKGLHAWIHPSGEGYGKQTILDAPDFLLNETLLRCPWNFTGEKPLLLRVYGEATLYIAAQCPPLGGVDADDRSQRATLHGLRKALGAEIPDWPKEERPLLTAGFHPNWRGPSGYGELQRVEGFTMFVSHQNIEVPVYKIVLAPPTNGMVDVIVCWRFTVGCEALSVVLRGGHIHCKEEDWPIAEFNEEIRQITPLQDYSGFYLRRGLTCLIVDVILSVLARIWLLGSRPMWWLEPVLMLAILLPAVVTTFGLPINIKNTQVALSMNVVNQAQPFMHEEAVVNQPSGTERSRSRTRSSHHGASSPFSSLRRLSADARSMKQASFDASRRSAEAAPSMGASPSSLRESSHSPIGRTSRVRGAWPAGRHPSAEDFGAPLDDEPPLHPVSAGPGCHSSDGDMFSDAVAREGRIAESAAKGIASGCCRAGGCCGAATCLAKPCLRIDTRQIGEQPSSRQPRSPVALGPPRWYSGARDSSASSPAIAGRGEHSPAFLSSDSGPPVAEDGCFPRRVSHNSAGSQSPHKPKLPPPLVHLSDLAMLLPSDQLPSVSPVQGRRWMRFKRRIKAKVLTFCRRRSDTTGTEDTMTAIALHGLTKFLDVMFLVSALIVVGSPVVDWGQTSVALGPVAIPSSRRLSAEDGHLQLAWRRWEVAWPPFFQPTAAALDEYGGDLYVASSAVLRRFRCNDIADEDLDVVPDIARSGIFPPPRLGLHRGPQRRCAAVEAAKVLPEAIRGLGFAHGTLFAFGDSGVYSVKFLPNADAVGEDTGLDQGGLLGALGAALRPESSQWEFVARHGLGELTAATAAELGATSAGGADGPPMIGAVLSTPGLQGGSHFAALSAPSSVQVTEPEIKYQTGGDAGGALKLLAPLSVAGAPFRNLTGVFLAPGVDSRGGIPSRLDGEPILWAVEHGSFIVGLGLRSGEVVGAADPPLDVGAAMQGHSSSSWSMAPSPRSDRRALRGTGGPQVPPLFRPVSNPGDTSLVVVLTGNATHLVAVLPAAADGTADAAIFSAPLPPRLGRATVAAPEHESVNTT
mmetsp:Transcript_62730/g.181806  ORF Transcript_62730/g.181806 Transcript_62730/m.181806 type:complete len:1276 (+) Transcript_62730:200-4027(+)